jgi:AcrR family transcriptional regulator
MTAARQKQRPLMPSKTQTAAVTRARQEPPAQQAKEKKSREREIVSALRRCVLDKGYAQTSITDVARAAEMSVSHVLYYYANKDAILVQVAKEFHERILTGIGADREEPPEERIHLLVDNLLVSFPREELGMLRELIAAAGHSPPLHANLSQFAGTVSGYLEDLFAATPRQPGMSAQDAAETAAAMWMGLLISTSFKDQLDDRKARRIFRKALLALANFDMEPALQSGAKAPPRKRPRGST